MGSNTVETLNLSQVCLPLGGSPDILFCSHSLSPVLWTDVQAVHLAPNAWFHIKHGYCGKAFHKH